ncbi:hypothetical protein GCM10023339_02150 [Alloalcanivorax gelatiniphagus]
MNDIVWSYRDSSWNEDRDLVGYEVEADGGSIGKVDAASTETAAQWLVVDTGFWIFGKKRVIPAGVVVGMDHEGQRVIISMTKDQVKAAPDYDDADWANEDARLKHAGYYEQYADRPDRG